MTSLWVSRATTYVMQWIVEREYLPEVSRLPTVSALKLWYLEKMQPIRNMEQFKKGARLIHWQNVFELTRKPE